MILFCWKFICLVLYVCEYARTAWVTQHPPMHHPKIPFWDFMDGMKLSPRGQFTWSVYIFFFCSFFSPSSVFLSIFFGPPFTPSFFFGKLLPTPTHLPPFFLPTHIPPSSCWPSPHPRPPFALTSIAKASNLKRAWVVQNFKSVKPIGASRAKNFKSALARGASTWWQQEHKSKRSFKVVADMRVWR